MKRLGAGVGAGRARVRVKRLGEVPGKVVVAVEIDADIPAIGRADGMEFIALIYLRKGHFR